MVVEDSDHNLEYGNLIYNAWVTVVGKDLMEIET
jgi:hypothetical protein